MIWVLSWCLLVSSISIPVSATQIETSPEIIIEPVPESESKPELELVPELESEPGLEPQPESGVEPEKGLEPEPELIPETGLEQESVALPESVVPDSESVLKLESVPQLEPGTEVASKPELELTPELKPKEETNDSTQQSIKIAVSYDSSLSTYIGKRVISGYWSKEGYLSQGDTHLTTDQTSDLKITFAPIQSTDSLKAEAQEVQEDSQQKI